MTLKTGDVIFPEQESNVTIPESISIFGFSISFFGLFLVFAALVGIWMIVRESKRKQQNVEWNLTLITLAIVSAIVGGRIYYVLFQWRIFVEEPITLLNLRGGGLCYFGALFGAWAVIKRYCRKKDIHFLQSADTLVFGAAAAAPLVWIGCAMVREPMGLFYEGVFSVRISESYLSGHVEPAYADTLLENARRVGNESYVSVHPVALYGLCCSVVIFFILLFFKRKLKVQGDLFSLYLFLNSVTCFVLEFFRAERCYIWGTGIPVNCVVATVLVITVTVGWLQRFFEQKKPWEKQL